MADWVVGQRCASNGEPALGLGLIKEISRRNLQVIFPATGMERTYSLDKAPLRRVAFEPGEMVRDNYGGGFEVVEVKEQNGILFYLGDQEEDMLPETELNHSIVFSRPHQKLLAGQVNRPTEFDLRVMAWDLKHKSLSAPCRGLIGARIELIPHQLYIAKEVAGRRQPRVLLSDEVGLGKTIEAGLIFHQLWITGEVRRVLCLTPGSLLTQWLTEFYRKFNVLFSMMTPTQAEELTRNMPDANPYMSHQCVLQDIQVALHDPELREMIVEGDWDLVIVDEAHHLLWSENDSSPEYELVEEISQRAQGLLLLTATPRQLGVASHFGRLRLLDPERFDSLQKFEDETKTYAQMAAITEQVLSGKGKGVRAKIAELFPEDSALIAQAPDKDGLDMHSSRLFCKALVDRHGTGRMVFRNHRKVLEGFPKRTLKTAALPTTDAYAKFVEKAIEAMPANPTLAAKIVAGAPAFNAGDIDGKPQTVGALLQKGWRDDPRLKWLLTFLREHEEDKFLLICSSKAVVLALQEWLGLAPDLEVSVFHEEMTLLERDRQAAYFAKDNGARVLICSEIGSEGRNFQFAHKLILFDLPLNPALLEQRIGRLDRIGQRRDVEIFVPYAEGSPLAHLCDWYHLALDAFEHPLLEGDFIYEEVKDDISIIFQAVGAPDIMGPFIEDSRAFTEKLRATIESGRDRLLELNSFDPERAASIVNDIEEVETDAELKSFMDGVFELFRVVVEDQDALHTQIVSPSPQMSVERFPGLPEEGLEITYDREKAVHREELAFLSYDHPMVTGAIDLLLGQDRGAASFALWKGAPSAGILLDCLFVIEPPGADDLQLERYLAPTPIRVAVDQNKQVREDLLDELFANRLDNAPIAKLHQQREALTAIVQSLLAVAEEHAENLRNEAVDGAEQTAMNELKEEYDRLKALIEINPSVHPDELLHIEERLNLIVGDLEASMVRLDAVRLILMTP